jgi:pimeloyl-ACP methyl ester carboxylesterase
LTAEASLANRAGYAGKAGGKVCQTPLGVSLMASGRKPAAIFVNNFLDSLASQRNDAVPRLPIAILVTLVLLGGQAPSNAQPPAASTTNDIAFVADGAGNYQLASKNLRETAASINAPLKVVTFVWSHGYKRILVDQTDLPHSRCQGQHLAEIVLAYRKDHPEARIHLVGHSAGSLVVLAATEFLPPQTLDRIVLLAPAVSTEYDIRPALRCVRGSLEVHYSEHDWIYLGLCTHVVGCTDRRYCPAGGRVGFQLQIDCPADAALLPRLVQHPWQPEFRLLGHEGGHYGAYQPEYLKAQILPVLLSPCQAP